jgi:hypothetical protein
MAGVTEPITFTVDIQITDEHIERAIIKATSRVEYDEDLDEEEIKPLDLNRLVEVRLGKQMNKAIAEVTAAVTREVVEQRVRAALDGGFPKFSQWGQEQGRTTLAELVGQMVFKKGSHGEFDLESLVRREAAELAKRIVAEHVKAASAQVDAIFKEAATEGLAALFKRKLGVG